MPAILQRRHEPAYVQRLPQPVALLGTSYPAGHRIAPHSHDRDQLLYAISGTMWIRTAAHAWIVPPDRALYMPAGLVHSVAMRGPVEMRTLYILPDAGAGLPRSAAVIGASELLRALVLGLLEEPVAFEPNSRADRIAALILDEIARAPPLPLSFPMPKDQRLLKLCEAIIEKPASDLSLEDWADRAGASRRTLARLFAAECGLTFTAWRQRVRLHNAVEALTGGEPIGSVARANGYGSPSAFSAAFRQVLGVAPSSLARR